MGKIAVALDPVQRKKYREQGFWGDATLLDFWKMSAKTHPDKTAVADSYGKKLTYRELDGLSDRLAGYLVREAGVEPGDVVSVQLPSWVEFTVAYISVLKAGAVMNSLMPKFRESELIYRMGKCRTKVLFSPTFFHKVDHVQMVRNLLPELPDLKTVIFEDKGAGFGCGEFPAFWDVIAHAEPIEEYPKACADDVAIILFTSGTEGRGKGVMLTHNNMIANMKGYTAATNLNFTDSMLMSVPLGHATGLMYGVTVPFMAGMTSVLLEKFEAEACLQHIEKERCTVIMGPTVIAADIICFMEEHPDKYDFSSLRYFYCGGAPVPRTLVEKGLRLGIRLLDVYGATESAPHCVVPPHAPIEKTITTDGRPILGVEVKIVDDSGQEVPTGVTGEEYSRGPNMFVGYLDDPELTAAAFDNGWYKSGDLCHMDKDGYVRVDGRKKDIIIRGGENISSAEIEDILLRHPHIRQVAVVAYPDDRLGEKACAYIVLNDPAHPLDLKAVQAHMAGQNVAKYKWPERVELIEELPRNPSGKVLKYVLREHIKAKIHTELAARRCTGAKKLL